MYEVAVAWNIQWVTKASYERAMQVPLFLDFIYYIPRSVKSLLSLLFVPPFRAHTVTSDSEPLNLN